MKRLLFYLMMVVSLLMGTTVQAKSPKKLKALVVSGQNNHNWQVSHQVLKLILDNERVVLPGLGSFVAEIVPASFSDKGYTINPPYRKLYFRSKPDEGSDLIPFYAKNNSVSVDVAEKVITDFVSELKAILFHKKTVIFPGLGRLRATKENNVFFVADEDLDIYPEGFAFEPISLKTHVETREEVQTVMEELKAIVDVPTSPDVPASSEIISDDQVQTEIQTSISTESVSELEPEPVPDSDI